MNSSAAKRLELTQFEQLSAARDVIRCEARALQQLADNLPITFYDAVQLIANCHGLGDRHGNGESRLDCPKNIRVVCVHRNAQPFPAPREKRFTATLDESDRTT